MSLIRHGIRRCWGAGILGLAALAPIMSSCGGQPAAVKPVVIAGVVPSQAKENLRAQTTAMTSETSVAVANATGVARDEAIIKKEEDKLHSYATATAVTIERARARAIARRTAIAVATETKRAAIERAQAQKTAEAFQAIQAKQLVYDRSLRSTISTFCWPGVKTLAGVVAEGNAALQSRRAVSHSSVAGLHTASKEFTACRQKGSTVASSLSSISVRNHFQRAVNDFALAVNRVHFGLQFRDPISLQQGAAVLWQGNDDLQLIQSALPQSS